MASTLMSSWPKALISPWIPLQATDKLGANRNRIRLPRPDPKPAGSRLVAMANKPIAASEHGEIDDEEARRLVEELESLEEEAIAGKDEGREPTDYDRRARIFDESSRVFQALKERGSVVANDDSCDDEKDGDHRRGRLRCGWVE